MGLQFTTYIFKTVTLHLLHGHNVQTLIQKKETPSQASVSGYLLFPLLELKAYATHVDFHGCRKLNLASFLWDKNLTELSVSQVPTLPTTHLIFYFLRKGFI